MDPTGKPGCDKTHARNWSYSQAKVGPGKDASFLTLRLNEARMNGGDGWREILSFWPPWHPGGHKAESSQD